MEGLYFTVGQFSRLHHLNRRTLHYYDEIGLFSPAHKAENGYRYYTYRQSAELEHILALRELGMSIEQIKDYLTCPGADAFLRISLQKTQEIDAQIKRLQQLKHVLRERQSALALCGEISDGTIAVVQFPQRVFTLTPTRPGGATDMDMDQVLAHLQAAWADCGYKAGCGTYLSMDKVRRGEFALYDGLFTASGSRPKGPGLLVRPKGGYLCGYCVGSWDKIPALYAKMLDYAAAEGLALTGNCYEMGLNEFAISRAEDYVTRIEIQCVT